MTPLSLADVMLIEPKVFHDKRGFFFESFHHQQFEQALGRTVQFVQDNHSHSHQHVLRGLHFQTQQPQGKLIRVVVGEVFDVAVDLRLHSATYGQWVGVRLSAQNRHQLWIPEGFGHGFLVLSDHAELLYKTTNYYAPQYEAVVRWDDPTLNINWPLAKGVHPILSAKDQAAMYLSEHPHPYFC